MLIEENKALGLSIKTLISLACSVIIGFPFLGASVFHFHTHCSLVITFGILFSLFYFSINSLGLRKALLLVILLILLEEILSRKSFLYSHWVILSDGLYLGLMVLSTFFFHKIIHRENLKTHVLVYPILGIFFFLGAVLHYLTLIMFMPNIYQGLYALYFMAIPEFLSGMGISIGIYLCERTKLIDLLNIGEAKLKMYKY